MKRTGSAVWKGEIKAGSGTVSTESGVLAGVPYSFGKRFGDEAGTNPEELIGAAHASCFAMALSGVLGGKGMTAEALEVSAAVTVVPAEGGGFEITRSDLTLRARIPGADEAAFRAAADEAKAGCPVSKVLRAEVTLDAALVS